MQLGGDGGSPNSSSAKKSTKPTERLRRGGTARVPPTRLNGSRGDLVGERFLDGTRPKCRRQSGTGISIIPSFAAFYWYDSFTKTCWRSEMEMVWPTSRPFVRYLFAIWYWWKTWCKGGMGQVTKS